MGDVPLGFLGIVYVLKEDNEGPRRRVGRQAHVPDGTVFQGQGRQARRQGFLGAPLLVPGKG